MARKKKRGPGPAGNLDYIKHGSDEHAALLGLKRAEEGDSPTFKDWALADITLWGPTATDTFLMNVLKGKVNELNSSAPPVQSEEPLGEHYVQPMWTPG